MPKLGWLGLDAAREDGGTDRFGVRPELVTSVSFLPRTAEGELAAGVHC